jgi:hypothetical protein
MTDRFSSAEIFDPFFSLVYPEGERIAKGDSFEARSVENFFSGKTWSDISLCDFSEKYEGDPAACLSFMTPAAYRYFFPLFMRSALLEHDGADAIFDVVVNKLYQAACGDVALRSIYEEYQPKQLNSIAKYLSVLSDRYSRYYPVDYAKEALEIYWSQYLIESK